MVPYALVGGALSRTRQNAVDNRLRSTATPITSTSDIESSAPFTATGGHHDRRRDGRQRTDGGVASVERITATTQGQAARGSN
jgi:hypothetical protein